MSRQTILLTIENPVDLHTVRRCLSDFADNFDLKELSGTTDAGAALYEVDAVCAIIQWHEGNNLSSPIPGVDAPVVYIFDTPSPDLEAQRLESGAALCLSRDDLSPELFKYCLPLVIDRHRLANELTSVRVPFEQRDLERELSALMSWYYRTTATAQSFGLNTVREASPAKFVEITETLAAVMDQTLDEKFYRVPAKASDALHELGQKLGLLNAGPRDVIELYALTLKSKMGRVPQSKARAYADVSRTIALELMGHVTSYYKNLARMAMKTVATQQQRSGD